VDETAPGNGKTRMRDKDKTYRSVVWKGVECSNPSSVFFKSLLNIGANGYKMQSVVWDGCRDGERTCG
jgi:hypothetical protein